MEKILYPTRPVRCIMTGPSESGKSLNLTNLFLNCFNEFDEICIYSPSLHQDTYRILNKCISSYIRINIIPDFFNGEDIDLLIVEIIIYKYFEKSDREIETYESTKYPQEYDDGDIIILDYLIEKQMNDPRVLAMFK